MKEFDFNHHLNVYDHSGYSPSQLFVKSKYSTFKQEILNYKSFTMDEYSKTAVPKVNQYINTRFIKQTRAKSFKSTGYAVPFQYEIKEQSTLSFDHLLSLTLYTDFTALCTDFSGTFRGQTLYEPLDSIKSRNACYYWMSRRLRETVQLFGVTGHIWERVPLFCGLSHVMIFPQFQIRLCCPTSTTKEMEIAARFSGDEGIIVELATKIHRFIRGFNCQWLSQYKEESEVLFFGGHYQIAIQSVRIMETQKNYKICCNALVKIERMVNAQCVESADISMDEKSLIKDLVNWKLNGDCNGNIDKYIYDTFQLFTKSKALIVLNLYWLDCNDRELLKMVMYDVKKMDQDESQFMDQELMRNNIFRPELLQIFDNVKKIVIGTTGFWGKWVYPLSLTELLSLIIRNASLETIVVKAHRKNSNGNVDGCDTWISVLWSASSVELIRAYNEQGLIINKQTMQTATGTVEDCLIITNTK